MGGHWWLMIWLCRLAVANRRASHFSSVLVPLLWQCCLLRGSHSRAGSHREACICNEFPARRRERQNMNHFKCVRKQECKARAMALLFRDNTYLRTIVSWLMMRTQFFLLPISSNLYLDVYSFLCIWSHLVFCCTSTSVAASHWSQPLFWMFTVSYAWFQYSMILKYTDYWICTRCCGGIGKFLLGGRHGLSMMVVELGQCLLYFSHGLGTITDPQDLVITRDTAIVTLDLQAFCSMTSSTILKNACWSTLAWFYSNSSSINYNFCRLGVRIRFVLLALAKSLLRGVVASSTCVATSARPDLSNHCLS